MHCLFLGLFQATCGSMIWELVQNDSFAPRGMPMSSKLDSAFGAWKAFLAGRRQRIDARKISLGMLGNPQKGNYPDLQCKAHDTRMCVSWLDQETRRATDVHTEYGQRRATLACVQQAECTRVFNTGRWQSLSTTSSHFFRGGRLPRYKRGFKIEGLNGDPVFGDSGRPRGPGRPSRKVGGVAPHLSAARNPEIQDCLLDLGAYNNVETFRPKSNQSTSYCAQ